ncbi:restriction endonuclease [Streptomyces ipomoeae]|uniref:restriction endonuclease n=1 Tax=Streptomyces ipomoeae TaxID=103232 RepID=UPI001147781F|nr:restriction endonuclease [Streptomyces ipomoeae]TQE33030.1 restriction endonuclease [Streptomyces ipomoeae]
MANTSRRPRLPGRRPAVRRARPPRAVLRQQRARRPRKRASLGNRITGYVLAAIALFLFLRANPVVAWALGALLLLAVAAAIVIWRHRRSRRRRLIDGVRTLHEFRSMLPADFEHAVAALCRRDGCSSVQVVGGSGDLGADVVATTPDGRRVVIQCKRYAAHNLVGSPDAQRVGGTARQVHGADEVAIVTTSGFTTEAVAYAALPQVNIHLVNGEGLIRWQADGWQPPWL